MNRKINKSILFLIIILTPLLLFSQKDTCQNKNFFTLKTDVLLPTIGLLTKFNYFTLSGEYSFKKYHSIELSGLRFWKITSGYGETTDSRLLIADYKYFIKRETPFQKFFVGVFSDLTFEYWYYHPSQNIKVEYDATRLGFGPLAGYQKYYGKKLSFDFIFGFGRNFLLKKEILQLEGTSGVLIINWYSLRLGFNIGYRF